MQHLYWIRTKVPGFQGKKVTFNPNPFQRLKYNLVYVQGKKRIITLKSGPAARSLMLFIPSGPALITVGGAWATPVEPLPSCPRPL